MTAPGTTVSAHWCDSCETAVDEPVVVYECSRCNQRDDERRCPDCNIFKGRAEEDGCPECFEEVTEVELVIDHDGALVRSEDYDPAGEANAARREREQKAATDARRTRQEQAYADLVARSTTTTWGEVSAGDMIVPSEPDKYATVTNPDPVLHVARTPDGRRVVAMVEQFSHPTPQVHDVDEPVVVAPEHEDFDTPYGTYTLLDGNPRGASSPMTQIDICVQNGTRENGLLPTMTLRTTTKYGNMLASLGQWVDPTIAAAALDVLAAAAERLRSMPGATVTLNPEVSITRDGWPLAELTRSAEVKVGLDSWHGEQPLIDVRLNRQSVAFNDAGILAAAVVAARSVLHELTMTPWRAA